MSPRSRRRQLFVLNRRWSIGVVVAVAAVVAGIIGIALVEADQIGRPWAYLFLSIALIGAVGAMIMTIARSRAGDEIDEAKEP